MKVYLLNIALFLSTIVQAQIYIPDFKNITITEGLSHNTVRCIQKDEKGFMWFGTYDGLNRFDGINFKIYKNKSADSLSLNNNHISFIYNDTFHNLWVGTRKGLNRLDKEKDCFRKFYLWNKAKVRKELINTSIQQIIQDSQQTLFIATSGQGVLRWDNERKLFTQIPLFIDGRQTTDYYSSAMIIDKHGKLLISIDQEGIGYLAEDNTIRLLNNKLKNIKTFCSGDSVIYIGNDNTVWTYSPETNEISNSFPNLSINEGIVQTICLDHNKILWIGTEDQGISLFDTKTKNLQNITAGHNNALLSSLGIYNIYQDNDHCIWIGTMRGGVQMFDTYKHFFSSRKNNQNLSPTGNFINAFAEMSNEEILIGTDGQGLHIYNYKKDIFVPLPNFLQPINTFATNTVSLESAPNEDIWVGSYGNGLIRYCKKNNKTYRYTTKNSKLISNYIWSLYKDSNNDLWIGTVSPGGLYRFTPQSHSPEPVNLNVSNGVICLAENKDKELMIGTYESLIIYQPKSYKSILYNIGFPVRTIIEDQNEHVFIGTEGNGLCRLDKQKGTISQIQFPNKEITNNNVLSILQDSRSNLWLSTYNGLYAYNPINGKTNIFTKDDGLQSNQFNYSASLKSNDDKFFFGGINGFTFFDSKEEYKPSQESPIHIIDLRILNKSIANHQYQAEKEPSDILNIQKITLPFEDAYFSIDYIAISHQNPNKVVYTYYLEGVDKTWNSANDNRRASYSQLKEGTYHFYVKGLDKSGNTITKVRSLEITILPPWYRSWWAYLIYIILFGLTTYILLHLFNRQNQLKQNLALASLREQHDKEITLMKEQFFINISHELRTPLSLIISPLKDYLNQSKYTPPLKNEIKGIYSNAVRLLSLINQLLLYRKDEMGKNQLLVSSNDFVKFVQGVYCNFEQIATKRGIEYLFTSNVVSEVFLFDKEKMEIILYNLLSNAFKYTQNYGKISISLNKKEENRIVLTLSDNGCGISKEELTHIFHRFYSSGKKSGIGIGLSLVKNFVMLHKGEIDIQSEPGQGTSFILTFNTDQLYSPNERSKEEDVGSEYTASREISMLMEYDSDFSHPNELYSTPTEATGENTPRILIVEDNPEIRQYIKKCLLLDNIYDIKEAENGKDALKIAKQFLPDIIISDILMEKMSGLELCRQIKQNEETNHIYVILITADLSESTEYKSMEFGADEFLTKPFDSIKLLNKVATIVKYKDKAIKYFSNKVALRSEPKEAASVNTLFIDKCISLIRQKYNDENFTAVQFSIDMNMSQSALYKKIKLCTDKSLNEFIRMIKLTIAAELIQKGELTISEIANDLGFSDIKYFREIFKKQFGSLPSGYQKKD